MFSRDGERLALSTYEVVITVRAVLVALVELRDIFPEGFLALLADERHLCRLRESVGLRFCVAFGAIEPLLAAGRADGNLGIQDVLATVFQCRRGEREIVGWRTTCCRVRDRLEERTGFSRLQRLAPPRLKFRPYEIRSNFREMVCYTLSTRHGCDASPKENAKKIREKSRMAGKSALGPFLRRRQMPTVNA